jgi:hypothetical protein
LVTVIGQNYSEDGLQLALQDHVDAHARNAVSLLNVADQEAAAKRGERGPKLNAPRPAYKHQPFPKHLYSADGRDMVVASPAEFAAAQEQGFRAEPYPVVRVAVSDPAAEKAALEAKLRESDGKIASQNELLQKLMEQVQALVKAKK